MAPAPHRPRPARPYRPPQRGAGRPSATRGDRSRPPAAARRRRAAAAVVLAALVALAVTLIVLQPGATSGHAAHSHGAGRPLNTGGPTSTTSTPHASSSTTTSASATSTTPRATSYRIATTSLTLHEPSAPGDATTTVAGAPVRVLPVVVRYPTAASSAAATPGARFPLIVFSAGFDIDGEAYGPLLDGLARAGFVVASPTFPSTDPSDGTVNETDIVNHPGDLRYVIGALAHSATQPSSPLHGVLDARHVAVVGHSDGGDVSFAAAENSCCDSAHIDAAVILSGAELSAFGGRYAARRMPLLVVQGSVDTINVPGCSAQLYDGAPQPKYYLDVLGADHQQPYLYPGPLRDGVVSTVTAFLRRYLLGEPNAQRSVRLPPTERLSHGARAPGPKVVCPGAP